MEKQAILVVSFGTTKDETRKKTIDAIEERIRREYPQFEVRRAFTSSIVRKRLADRDVLIASPVQALEKLKQEGYTQVFVLPTHLIPGEEYERLLLQMEPYKSSFSELRTARPLLYDIEDFMAATRLLKKHYPVKAKEALLLMGHGTEHFANCVYPAMDYVLKQQEVPYAYVACVEGYPKVEAVLQNIKAEGYERVHLAPLMLVAGEHAIHDMAGEEPDSWKNLCIEAGLQVRLSLTGLGEFEETYEMYQKHLERVINLSAADMEA